MPALYPFLLLPLEITQKERTKGQHTLLTHTSISALAKGKALLSACESALATSDATPGVEYVKRDNSNHVQ